jgi:hypothetical protein
MLSKSSVRTRSKKARAGSRKYPSRHTNPSDTLNADGWVFFFNPSPYNAPPMTNEKRFQDIKEPFNQGSGKVFHMIVNG